MQICTAWSTATDTAEAIRDAYDQLEKQLSRGPSLIIVYLSEAYDAEVALSHLTAFTQGVPIHGGTSCLGVMTAEGFHARDGVGLGLWAIADDDGAYGVGKSLVGGDARKAGAEAITNAIANAQRFGEPPELVWLSGVPGSEEAVLRGIQDVIGAGVPIAGGSTADNNVAGQWQQMTVDGVFQDAIVVTAMYPSVDMHLSFHSGYSITDVRGIVTRAEDRLLREIDHRPAADVYNEWTGGAIEGQLSGGNVLALTTLHPLGRRVGQVGDVPYYRLSHPDAVTEDKGLTLFSDIEEGDELILMAGTRESLVTRAGRVAQSALNSGRISADDIAGALVVYCAGCMLTVQDAMESVSHEVRDALGDAPFIGTFTFGEQGCFAGGENRHGNLMISVVVFEKSA